MNAAPELVPCDRMLFAERCDVAQLGKLVDLAAGTSLTLDPADGWILYLRHGRILANSLTRSGQHGVTLLRGAGDLVGLERLRGSGPAYEVFALTDVRACLLWVDELRARVAGDSAPVQTLLDHSIDALASSLAERIALRGTALQRVARFLVAAAGEDGAALTLPKHVIAQVLQMRPETLSRSLRKLEQAGVIAVRRTTHIVDVEALGHMLSD
jgi:CRP/FNR family transcriptional regulator, cyclic AMP receptor protein